MKAQPFDRPWSIHTAFMRFPIDVVFLDPDLTVIHIVHELRPWRTATYREAREIVELAAGECERRGLEVGDQVAWASVADLETAPARVAETRARSAASSSQPRPALRRLMRFVLDRHGFEVDVDPCRPPRRDRARASEGRRAGRPIRSSPRARLPPRRRPATRTSPSWWSPRAAPAVSRPPSPCTTSGTAWTTSSRRSCRRSAHRRLREPWDWQPAAVVLSGYCPIGMDCTECADVRTCERGRGAPAAGSRPPRGKGAARAMAASEGTR